MGDRDRSDGPNEQQSGTGAVSRSQGLSGMESDAQTNDAETWQRLEAEYRKHLDEHGFGAAEADAVCVRMRQHFERADVEFGVWGKLPMPDDATPKQAEDAVVILSELVESLAAQVHQHTRRLLWEIFELELQLATDRAQHASHVTERVRTHH